MTHHSCIGWVQVGDAWALCVLHFCVCPKLICCSCICHGLEVRLHVLPPIIDLLWYELFFDPPFFMACFLQELGLAWSWAFLPFSHCLLLLLAYQYSCHAILLFLLQRYLIHACWAFFGPTVYFSLSWLKCPNMVIGFIFILLADFLTHYITCGLLWPISFSLGILGPFAFLGHPRPIF